MWKGLLVFALLAVAFLVIVKMAGAQPWPVLTAPDGTVLISVGAFPLFVQWAQELGWQATEDSAAEIGAPGGTCWALVPPSWVFQETWRFCLQADGVTQWGL